MTTGTITETDRDLFRWTVEDYHAVAELGVFDQRRVELLDGVIYDRAPQGPLHSIVVSKITRYLVRNMPDRFFLVPQSSFALDPNSEPEPDIAIIEGEMEDFREMLPSAATLLIEVALTSLRFDRGRKLAAYARAGVPEYWIVNLQDEQLEVHREPDSGTERYRDLQTLLANDQVTAPMDGMAIPVAELL